MAKEPQTRSALFPEPTSPPSMSFSLSKLAKAELDKLSKRAGVSRSQFQEALIRLCGNDCVTRIKDRRASL